MHSVLHKRIKERFNFSVIDLILKMRQKTIKKYIFFLTGGNDPLHSSDCFIVFIAH